MRVYIGCRVPGARISSRERASKLTEEVKERFVSIKLNGELTPSEGESLVKICDFGTKLGDEPLLFWTSYLTCGEQCVIITGIREIGLRDHPPKFCAPLQTLTPSKGSLITVEYR